MNVPTAIAFIVLCAAVVAAAVATVRLQRGARRAAAAGCSCGCAGCSKNALCDEYRQEDARGLQLDGEGRPACIAQPVPGVRFETEMRPVNGVLLSCEAAFSGGATLQARAGGEGSDGSNR